MSAVTAGAKWLGSLFADAMTPKTAGTAAAGAGILYPSEEAGGRRRRHHQERHSSSRGY